MTARPLAGPRATRRRKSHTARQRDIPVVRPKQIVCLLVLPPQSIGSAVEAAAAGLPLLLELQRSGREPHVVGEVAPLLEDPLLALTGAERPQSNVERVLGLRLRHPSTARWHGSPHGRREPRTAVRAVSPSRLLLPGLPPDVEAACCHPR